MLWPFHLSGVEVTAQGDVWATPFGDTVASIGFPVEIVRGLTTFSCGHTPSNTYVFAWRDAAVGRDTDNLASAAIELFRNGDIATTTNGVVQVLPRELPFPHDGFGQDEDWVRANFTNAEEILSAGYPAWVDACAMARTNGLYKFTVSFASMPPETLRLSVGDLSVVVDSAGDYVFLLKKGVRYPVEMSFVPVDVSYDWHDGSEDIEETGPMIRGAVNNPKYTVKLGCTAEDAGDIEFIAPIQGASGAISWNPSLQMSPVSEIDPAFPILLSAIVYDIPLDMSPVVEWRADGVVLQTGEFFLWDGEDDVDSISVAVSVADAVLHGTVGIERHIRETCLGAELAGMIVVEDAYTNAPGQIVSASSTATALELSWSLADDGVLTLETDCPGVVLTDSSGAEVEMPCSWSGWKDEESEWILSASFPEGSERTGDIGSFFLSFSPDDGGPGTRTSTDFLKVVKIRVEAEADWPSNKVRHVFGVNEGYRVIADSGNSILNARAPAKSGRSTIMVNHLGAEIPVEISVVEPEGFADFEFAGEMTAQDWDAAPLHMPPLSPVTPGVGFLARMRLLPSNVNFGNILIMEGCAQMSNQTGCFTNAIAFPPSVYSHDASAGAGIATSVESEYNQVSGFDRIGVRFGVIPDYSGSYSLPIPVYWGIDGNSCTNQFAIVPMTISVSPVPDPGSDEYYLDITASKGNASYTRRCPDER